MAAEWTVLGAGSILPRVGYGSSGYALRSSPGAPVTLFDCGPGTIRSLASAGISVEEIERVVLSHYHPDHCLDLFALAFARRNPSLGVAPALELVGPRGLATWLERGAGLYGERNWLVFDRTTVREVDPRAATGRIECGAFDLTWVATDHTPESVAWRADLAGGASVTYSGDSGENPSVARLARATDLFVCECSFPDERAVPHHLTPSSAGRLARDASCARLLLTHFYPEMDPELARAGAAQVFAGVIELARDGSRHALERRAPSASTGSRR